MNLILEVNTNISLLVVEDIVSTSTIHEQLSIPNTAASVPETGRGQLHGQLRPLPAGNVQLPRITWGNTITIVVKWIPTSSEKKPI